MTDADRRSQLMAIWLERDSFMDFVAKHGVPPLRYSFE